MNNKKWRAANQRELIIEVWEALDCESVGARELRQIQQELRERFGEGAVSSPASIARAVADEGAALRHPEVLDCDLKWRELQLKKNDFLKELNFSSLSNARQSFVKLEAKRRERQKASDGKVPDQLRDFLSSARENSRLVARSGIIESERREEAREVSEWLGVWLQSPELFSDWLELRLRSPEFRKKFKADSDW
jgi:hypothetical protein